MSRAGPLLGRHLEQVLLVDLEKPPALLVREVRCAAPLVEIDGRLVPLGHDEVHATAAAFYRRLGGRGHCNSALCDNTALCNATKCNKFSSHNALLLHYALSNSTELFNNSKCDKSIDYIIIVYKLRFNVTLFIIIIDIIIIPLVTFCQAIT